MPDKKTFKMGDVIVTGTPKNKHHFRITELATSQDLKYITSVAPYLSTHQHGRQPNPDILMQIVSKLTTLERQGKLVEIKPQPKKESQHSPDKILNPATGRYVLKTGKIGKQLLKNK